MEGVELSKLAFNMIEYISKDLLRFGDFALLNASPFEIYNYVIKTLVWMISIRKDAYMGEAAKAMNAAVVDETWKDWKIS